MHTDTDNVPHGLLKVKGRMLNKDVVVVLAGRSNKRNRLREIVQVNDFAANNLLRHGIGYLCVKCLITRLQQDLALRDKSILSHSAESLG